MGTTASAPRPGEKTPADPQLIDRLLSVIEDDVLPLTRKGVEEGNKVFGAAIVRKSDLVTVHVATNCESTNPLNHGEVSCINGFYAMVNKDESKRVDPEDCYFLSTHEPCTMCASAITWAGFDNFYYFFSHEDSRDAFQIGHDLNILKQVFKHEPGGYARENSYWTAYWLIDMIGQCDAEKKAELTARVAKIKQTYDELSEVYQSTKHLCKNIALK